MSKAQIFIKTGTKFYEFSKSITGQLDYKGLWEEKKNPDLDGYQEIASSTYYSPSYYTYIQDELNNCPKVYVSPNTDVSDKDIFSYLTHVGALLSAIEAKDSLLAGELYVRRQEVFDNFAAITQYIMEPLCVEILFSLCFGRWNNSTAEQIPLLFNRAKKKLRYNPSRETLEQAFMDYFEKNDVTLTVSVVGNNHNSWKSDSKILEKIINNLNYKDLDSINKIRAIKHEFYSNLETVIQAEPYNPSDENAIVVQIESIDSKIAGNGGMDKAGYIRALGASIIRQAKPEKLSYSGRLVRLNERDIVVKMTI